MLGNSSCAACQSSIVELWIFTAERGHSFIQEYAEHRPGARDDMAQAFRSNDGQRCSFPPWIVNTKRRDNTIREINESRDSPFCLWDKEEARRRINYDFKIQSRM